MNIESQDLQNLLQQIGEANTIEVTKREKVKQILENIKLNSETISTVYENGIPKGFEIWLSEIGFYTTDNNRLVQESFKKCREDCRMIYYKRLREFASF
jgi:hypothetical protein